MTVLMGRLCEAHGTYCGWSIYRTVNHFRATEWFALKAIGDGAMKDSNILLDDGRTMLTDTTLTRMRARIRAEKEREASE